MATRSSPPRRSTTKKTPSSRPRRPNTRTPRPEAGEHDSAPPLELNDTPSENAPRAPREVVSPSKRVLLPQAETPKLHKVLAQSGLGSRLDMEALIREGRLTVNGRAAHVGQRVQVGDQIRFDGRPIRYQMAEPTPRVLAYHKPEGEIVSHDDPHNRPSVFRTLPRIGAGKWLSVGRLDLNTEGLLLFSNSGTLVNQLTHPRFGMEREYAVRVLGQLSQEAQTALLDGVMLDDGPARFESLQPLGKGEGVNAWYRVVIQEGRNREVRRLIEAVGHVVSRLTRVRYGPVVLPRGLRRGHWVELHGSDLADLLRAAGLDPQAPKPVAKTPTPRRHSPDRPKVKSTKPQAPARARAAAPAPRAAQPADSATERTARKDFIGEKALSRLSRQRKGKPGAASSRSKSPRR
ncbi:MAG: rRNA pseudouridine synthase [Betaproteobacteria bacterium]|nr:rRNA pseudouridine synthase [Betaproteobacteria bacterium]